MEHLQQHMSHHNNGDTLLLCHHRYMRSFIYVCHTNNWRLERLDQWSLVSLRRWEWVFFYFAEWGPQISVFSSCPSWQLAAADSLQANPFFIPLSNCLSLCSHLVKLLICSDTSRLFFVPDYLYRFRSLAKLKSKIIDYAIFKAPQLAKDYHISMSQELFSICLV